MIKKNLLLIILMTAFAAISCGKSTEQTKPAIPSARISATSNQDEGKVIFNVVVPGGHHAYLNRGTEENLIPVSFFWDDLVQSGILSGEPALVSKPQGVYDKEFEAQVLRGQGQFEFKIPSVSKLIGKTLRVRSQVCDETRGICYRPVTENILIN